MTNHNQLIDITDHLDTVGGGCLPGWLNKVKDKAEDVVESGKRIIGDVTDTVLRDLQPRPPLW